MALMASGVKLLDPLKDPLGGYAKKGKGTLEDVLGRVGGQAKTSAIASGRPVGEYQGRMIGQAGTMASRGIDDTLGGVLGAGSLQETKAIKEHEAKMALAKEIGDLMSPSMAEEILGGLGGGVNLGLQGKGLYDALGQGGGGYGQNPPYGSGQNPFRPSMSKIRGYDPYDYEANWGGR